MKGQNIVVEWRYAEGRLERVPQLAEELVKLPVDVLVVSNAGTAIRVQSAAGNVPIVVVAGGDLVAAGLAASLARPRGNVTGLQIAQPDLAAKRLELLRQIVSRLLRVGILVPRTKARTAADAILDSALREIESAGRSLGVQLYLQEVRETDEFPAAFSTLAKERVGAVTVLGDPFFLSQRGVIADLAIRNRLPTIYELGEHADAGGLMSYGPSLLNLCRHATAFVDRILRR